MLTMQQIMKRFGCEEFDAMEILVIQEKGVTHGKNDVSFETDEDFEDAVGMDIEHIETLMMADTGSVRRVYDAGVKAGRALRTKAA